MAVKPNSERELQGWSEVTVDDLKAANENSLSTGPFGSSIGSRFFESTGVPVIRGSNLANDGHTHLIEDSLVFLSEAKASEFRRSAVFEGDLIFTCWGTINQIGLISKRASYPRYIISNKQMKFTPDPGKADSLFLFYLFSGPELQRQIRNQSIGSSVPGFNLGHLRALRFCVPTLSQQKAIAEVLSDADALIESLEQLIVKKRQIKQGAMQELLTGKKRLPVFATKPGYKQTEVGVIPEDWEVTTVGNEFSIQLGKMLDSEKNVGVPKPYLGNRAVQWGRIDLSDLGAIKMTPSDLQRFCLCQGDLLVCEGGEIGRAAIWNEPIEECYYQKALHRLRPIRGYNVQLMLNVLQRWASAGFLTNFVTQTSIAHLPKDKFEEVPIPLPPTKAEQTAIAAILSDMDAEITALEEKLAKARQLKQGMMQELLTGRIRLV